MKFIGVDPGASGAIAIMDARGVRVFDTPFLKVVVGKTERKRINPAALHELLREQVGSGGFAMLERVQPQPKFGASSMFWLGHSLGVWEAALSMAAVSYQTVRAQEWKKLFGITKDARNKGQARQLAIRLFPLLAPRLARVMDDGRAEAALMAEYARRTYSQGGTFGEAVAVEAAGQLALT